MRGCGITLSNLVTGQIGSEYLLAFAARLLVCHLFHRSPHVLLPLLVNPTMIHLLRHRVLAVVNSKHIPVPVNIDSVNTLFNLSISSESEMTSWLESVQIKPKDGKATNSEEIALSRVGQDLYDLIFKPYTMKQWEKEPAQLAPSVLARIPVRSNHDDRYFTVSPCYLCILI